MMHFPYSIIIEPLSQDDGGGFLARVPDLPGCMSDGDTPEEAVTNVRDAMESWLEAAEDHGRPIPSPSPRLAAAVAAFFATGKAERHPNPGE